MGKILWYLLLGGLLYGAITEYWWLILVVVALALVARKRKKERQAQEDRRNQAIAEFEQIRPIDPLLTDLAKPIIENSSEEDKNTALLEINLIMWAARAVSEYHAIDELRNPVSDSQTKRDRRCVFNDKLDAISAIQRTCKIGYPKALELIPKLVELKFLVPAKNGSSYTARLTANEFEQFYDIHSRGLRALQGLEPMAVENTVSMDAMSGEEFEAFCADILSNNGFSDIAFTEHSGDHGIDLLAKKDGIAYAVQCKCYSSTVGNSAVQQAYSGKSLYGADVAVVMTNSHFSRQATEEAEHLRVRLWDREKLLEMQ